MLRSLSFHEYYIVQHHKVYKFPKLLRAKRDQIYIYIFFALVKEEKKLRDNILEAFAHFFTDPEIYSLSTPF